MREQGVLGDGEWGLDTSLWPLEESSLNGCSCVHEWMLCKTSLHFVTLLLLPSLTWSAHRRLAAHGQDWPRLPDPWWALYRVPHSGRGV